MSRPPSLRVAAVLSLCVAACQPVGLVRQPPFAARPLCAACFSPHGGCTEQVVAVIEAAQHRILVQAYAFTSQSIAEALRRAHERGVTVNVLLDKGQRADNRSAAHTLLAAGVPVGFDAAHAIAHNKVIVVDGATVITGSFNFTQAAEERNAENLLVIRDRELARQYEQNWREHQQHSQLPGSLGSGRFSLGTERQRERVVQAGHDDNLP